jgi:hypothetical protein
MVLDIILAHPFISLAVGVALLVIAKSLFASKPGQRAVPKGKYNDKVSPGPVHFSLESEVIPKLMHEIGTEQQVEGVLRCSDRWCRSVGCHDGLLPGQGRSQGLLSDFSTRRPSSFFCWHFFLVQPLVLEKKQFPRDKYCGDAVCKTAIEILMDMGLYDKLIKENKAKVVRSRFQFAPVELIACVSHSSD